jgi:uncharacterized cupredoxin-like copper-binding protein
VLVFAADDHLSASRPAVRAGRVRLQLSNIGEDVHDLAVRDATGRVRARTRAVRPGALGQVFVRLPAGRFTLFCSLADHEARGMRARLTVRPAGRRR